MEEINRTFHIDYSIRRIDLYGVKCIGKGIETANYEYEAVLFYPYKVTNNSAVIIWQEDVFRYEYHELITTFLSDTCIRFILFGYYDPEQCNFQLEY